MSLATCSLCGRLLPLLSFFDKVSKQYSPVCQQCQTTILMSRVFIFPSCLESGTVFGLSVSGESFKKNNSADTRSGENQEFNSSNSAYMPKPRNSMVDGNPVIQYVVPRSSWIVSNSRSSKNKQVDVPQATLIHYRSTIRSNVSSQTSSPSVQAISSLCYSKHSMKHLLFLLSIIIILSLFLSFFLLFLFHFFLHFFLFFLFFFLQ